MKEYHKIQTIYKRDPKTNNKTLLEGEFSLPEFELLKDIEWIGTEKVDGTNIRIMKQNGILRFGGKTDDAQIPSYLYDKLQDMFSLDKLNETFPQDVCLYGEGYGNKIQSVGKDYIPNGNNFILFDIRIGNWWLQRSDIEDIGKKFGIEVVPIVFSGSLSKAINLVRGAFLSTVSENKTLYSEGLVLKPKLELTARNGERIITKIKTKDFRKK